MPGNNAPTSNLQPLRTFTRLQHPDPTTNAIVQDLYNKFAQVQKQLQELQSTSTTS
jgi:hypothetical protein